MSRALQQYLWGDLQVNEFAGMLYEMLSGEDPVMASQREMTACRTIAHALKSIPIHDPRGSRIYWGLYAAVKRGIDTNSEDEMRRGIDEWFSSLRPLFQ